MKIPYETCINYIVIAQVYRPALIGLGKYSLLGTSLPSIVKTAFGTSSVVVFPDDKIKIDGKLVFA